MADVFEDEVASTASEFGGHLFAAKLVRFYIPEKARWFTVSQKTTGLSEYLTDAIRAVAPV